MRGTTFLAMGWLMGSYVAGAVNVTSPREFRAAWVCTVINLDWPSSKHLTTSQQQAEMITILDKLASLNMNAIVFQIRDNSDAFYNSTMEPWSRYLTGTEGTPPTPFYDPLTFVIQEGHRRNIEVHAWLNPYRAYKDGFLAKKYPQYANDVGGNSVVMDPGAKVIQDHVFNVFTDVTKRYDIDGVHMDDFFYPYPSKASHFDDHKTYEAYKASGGGLSLADWRRQNVNDLIKRLSDMIHSVKPWVKFGIAPFGIWKPGHPPGIKGLSAYDELYADSKKWIEEGWLDYLTPQLYWRIDPPQQSYTALLDWWLQQNPTHHHIYPGNAIYRVESSQWPVSEIYRQIEETRDRSVRFSLGNVLFRMVFLRSSVYDLLSKNLYKRPALVPVMPWLHDKTSGPAEPRDVVSGPYCVVTWSIDVSGTVRSWSIYFRVGMSWELMKINNKDVVYFKAAQQGKYAIRGVDRLSRESSPVIIAVHTDV